MVKDIVESVQERISAPYFGYLFCSFVGINWKALFFLFFAKQNVPEKISYFNDNTSWLSTIVFPLVLGAVITIASPYLKYLFAKIVEYPTRKMRDLDIMADEAAKRTKKLQDQKDQLEIEQVKLSNAELVIDNLNNQMSEMKGRFSAQEIELEKANENIKNHLKDINRLEENKKSFEIDNNLLVVKIAENDDLTKQFNQTKNKEMQYKNLSKTLEQLYNATKRLISLELSIRQDGPDEDDQTNYHQYQKNIKDLEKRAKIIKKNISETQVAENDKETIDNSVS